MTPFEYILPLVSVLVGLALADLAISIHRLLRVRGRVRWDWLPFATALLAILVLLETWWSLYGVQERPFFTALGGFLPLAVQLVLLFLLNAASLPDDVQPGEVDLRAFYEENGAYFWTLFAVYMGCVLLVKLAALIGAAAPGGEAGGTVANVVLLLLFVALARVRRRWFHAVAVSALLILFLIEWTGLRLEAGSL